MIYFFSVSVKSIKVANFQASGNQSDSHLLWQNEWPIKQNVKTLTVCARFKFSSLWDNNCFLQLDNPDDDEDKGNHQPISASK